MAKRHYSVKDVLSFPDGNFSDIEEFMEADNEVEDQDWTPNAEHDEESYNSSNEEDKSIDQRIEEEEEGPTVTQSKRRKKSARKKVTRKEYRWRKAEFEPPDVQFDESADEALLKKGLSLHHTCTSNSLLLTKCYSFGKWTQSTPKLLM